MLPQKSQYTCAKRFVTQSMSAQIKNQIFSHLSVYYLTHLYATLALRTTSTLPERSTLQKSALWSFLSAVMAGLSIGQIAQQLELSRYTVKFMLIAIKQMGQSMSKSRSGRPRVTTPHEDRVIVRAVQADRRISTEVLRETFQVFLDKNISPQTIRRWIQATGMHGRATRKTPFISKENKRNWLAHAKSFEPGPWTAGKRFYGLTRVHLIYLDQTGTFLCGESPAGSSTKSASCRHSKVAYKVAWCGGLWLHGVGTLVFCDEKMKSKDYLAMVEENLAENFAKLGLPIDFEFMQVNAPIDTTKRMKAIFDQNAFYMLPQPAQSPDLNPIEHMWEYIKRRVRKSAPSSLEAVKVEITQIWERIPVSNIRDVIESMPKRKKGGPTKY